MHLSAVCKLNKMSVPRRPEGSSNDDQSLCLTAIYLQVRWNQFWGISIKSAAASKGIPINISQVGSSRLSIANKDEKNNASSGHRKQVSVGGFHPKCQESKTARTGQDPERLNAYLCFNLTWNYTSEKILHQFHTKPQPQITNLPSCRSSTKSASGNIPIHATLQKLLTWQALQTPRLNFCMHRVNSANEQYWDMLLFCQASSGKPFHVGQKQVDVKFEIRKAANVMQKKANLQESSEAFKRLKTPAETGKLKNVFYQLLIVISEAVHLSGSARLSCFLPENSRRCDREIFCKSRKLRRRGNTKEKASRSEWRPAVLIKKEKGPAEVSA
nr:uncharacterized serine-rich protein C215.13-like [Ipomoea batatas]